MAIETQSPGVNGSTYGNPKGFGNQLDAASWWLWIQTQGLWGDKERVWEGEYGGILCTSYETEQWDLLKLFQESREGDKEEQCRGEFKYDML
jgi:hypothetical protein